MTTIRLSPSGPPIDVGGAAQSALWFVDAGAPAGGDGTVISPFKTFADAIAAAQADFTANTRNQTIILTPLDYQAEAAQSITLDGAHTLTLSAWSSVNTGGVGQPLLPVLTLPAGNVVVDGVSWVGAANPQLDVQAGDLNCANSYIQFYNCANLTAVDSSPQSGVVTNLAQFDNCAIAALTCTNARINNCRNLGPLNVNGNVFIDMFSNNGGVTCTGLLLVIGRCAQETQSVVVPAVAAGAVGYVNVVMTSQLALMPTGSPVVGNPTADLIAAGAGGGFINCRCSAPGVVRCAFVGPLAGGPVDFTFCSPAAL